MRAVTWQGRRDISVEEVPGPTIQEPTDAMIRVTSTAICGSDLHLYEVLTPFNVSCGHCYYCQRGLQSQCETTLSTDYGTGATLAS